MRNMRGISVILLVLYMATTIAEAKKEKQARDEEPSINPHHLPIPDNITLSIPKRIVYPDPVFPANEQARLLGAQVTLGIDVEPDGRVSEAIIIQCTVQNLGFEEAARSTVLSWQFVPAQQLKNGELIKDAKSKAVFMTIRVIFPAQVLTPSGQ